MRNPVSIISAGITAFVLALTAGTVYAYKTLAASAGATQPQNIQSSSAAQPIVLSTTGNAAPDVSPQDAASVAAQFLGRTDLYSAELADYQGTQSYKITFSSGDVVYVSLKGVVVGSELPPTPMPVIVTQGGGGGGHHGGGEGYSSSSGSHEGGESEHEDDGH